MANNIHIYNHYYYEIPQLQMHVNNAVKIVVQDANKYIKNYAHSNSYINVDKYLKLLTITGSKDIITIKSQVNSITIAGENNKLNGLDQKCLIDNITVVGNNNELNLNKNCYKTKIKLMGLHNIIKFNDVVTNNPNNKNNNININNNVNNRNVITIYNNITNNNINNRNVIPNCNNITNNNTNNRNDTNSINNNVNNRNVIPNYNNTTNNNTNIRNDTNSINNNANNRNGISNYNNTTNNNTNNRNATNNINNINNVNNVATNTSENQSHNQESNIQQKPLITSVLSNSTLDEYVEQDKDLAKFGKRKLKLYLEMDEYQYKHILKYDSRKETNCAICLRDFHGVDIIKAFYKCGHIFHKACLKNWLMPSNFCPLCKEEIPDDIEENYEDEDEYEDGAEYGVAVAVA